MASNNFKTLSQAATVTLATKLSAALTANPTSYGLTGPDALNLAGKLTAYTAAISTANSATAAARAAIQAKETAKANLVNLIAVDAKIIYAFPAITNALLAAAGLAIPAVPGTVTPQVPTNLVATPSPDGNVRLTWNRSGNPYGVTFAIETKTEGGTYSIIAVTDAAKLTLAGFTPGVAAWFRVFAVNRGISSAPSLEVSIYHVGGLAAPLQVAA